MESLEHLSHIVAPCDGAAGNVLALFWQKLVLLHCGSTYFEAEGVYKSWKLCRHQTPYS